MAIKPIDGIKELSISWKNSMIEYLAKTPLSGSMEGCLPTAILTAARFSTMVALSSGKNASLRGQGLC
jgi:hypothetical protein